MNVSEQLEASAQAAQQARSMIDDLLRQAKKNGSIGAAFRGGLSAVAGAICHDKRPAVVHHSGPLEFSS